MDNNEKLSSYKFCASPLCDGKRAYNEMFDARYASMIKPRAHGIPYTADKKLELLLKNEKLDNHNVHLFQAFHAAIAIIHKYNDETPNEKSKKWMEAYVQDYYKRYTKDK